MLSIQISLKLTATFSFKILKILNMLEETEAHSAPHKPVCVCVQAHAGTHTHKKKQLTPKEVLFIFPKGSCCVCKYHIVVNFMNFQLSDFYISTQNPAVMLSPAHRWTRKQHTIRLLSRVPSSLWDIAVGWFFICSFFMLH